jgi:hypothetical protein
MENRGGEIHVDTDEARGGSSPNVVRWVLAIGLLLAIIFMSLAWIIPALSRGGETQNVNVNRAVQGAQDDGRDTDSIVGENADEIPAPAEAPDEGGIPTIDNNDQAADTGGTPSPEGNQQAQ